MRRLHLPSPAACLAFLALTVALGGTALAATGQLVNIADPTTASQVAKVDATGKLNVGDGSGALTVDGTVTNREAAASNFLRFFRSVSNGSGCVTLYAPPSGSAAIIKAVQLNVFQVGPTGTGNVIDFFVGSSPCGGALVASSNPGGIGAVHVPFEPGVGIPAGQQLSAQAYGSPVAEVFGTGYKVSASSVPTTATKEAARAVAGANGAAG
jgi:hypothetical protein